MKTDEDDVTITTYRQQQQQLPENSSCQSEQPNYWFRMTGGWSFSQIMSDIIKQVSATHRATNSTHLLLSLVT